MIIESRCSIVLGGGGGAIRLTLQGQKKMKMKYKGKEKVKVSKTLSLIVGMNMSDTWQNARVTCNGAMECHPFCEFGCREQHYTYSHWNS